MSGEVVVPRSGGGVLTPTVVSWSGGKDSALALHTLLMDPTVEVTGLLTTVTDEYDRISMHGVRSALLLDQASSLGLKLYTSRIPAGCSNAHYESVMSAALAGLREDGVEAVAFGDLFLADVRAYRERLVGAAGLRTMLPLWGRSTPILARQFIDAGFRAVLACVDPRQVDVSHCGSDFDRSLLERLPSTADPCGEKGEFHTFVYDGPMFQWPIEARRGEIVHREGFVFCDLLPRDAMSATSGDASRGGMPCA